MATLSVPGTICIGVSGGQLWHGLILIRTPVAFFRRGIVAFLLFPEGALELNNYTTPARSVFAIF